MQLFARPAVGQILRRPLTVFLAIFILGAFLRLYNFPNAPVGLDRDELSAGYEAWSLLQYGTDRWGYHWPPYFYSWGSGQNVLYSYLTIPWIALFGLTDLAVRLTQVIFAIATLPILYLAAKRAYNRQVAMVAMFIFAVFPFGWLEARWGIESNLTPFFITLTVYALMRALGVGDPVGTQPPKRWIVVALLPAGLALYAYGLNLVPIGIILILCLIFFWRHVQRARQEWLIATMLFLLLALPFLLFMAKNYLPRDTSKPFPLDGVLPFDIPQLFASRLTQVQTGSSHIGSLLHNLGFIFSGYSEGHRYSDTFLPSLSPVPAFLGIFVLVALAVYIWRAWHRRRPARPTLFGMWALGFAPLLALFPMSTTESQGLVVPWVVFAAVGLVETYGWLRQRTRLVVPVALAAVLTFTGVNMAAYFGEYQTATYTRLFAERFSPELDRELPIANRLAKQLDVPLYVSSELNLNYMYTLWYLKIPATVFQQGNADGRPTVLDPDFGRYFFNANDTQKLDRYVYLQPKESAFGYRAPRCENLRIVRDTAYWRLMICTNLRG